MSSKRSREGSNSLIVSLRATRYFGKYQKVVREKERDEIRMIEIVIKKLYCLGCCSRKGNDKRETKKTFEKEVYLSSRIKYRIRVVPKQVQKVLNISRYMKPFMFQ